jgi:hypothetical protein
MSSPFRIFRKHQKVLMVVLVGLSMLSFVVCGAIQNVQDVSGPLLVALLALAVGSITWLIGLGQQKSTEYGAYGLLIGACAGLVLSWNFSAPPAIRMKGGNISNEQLAEMQERRHLANQFVQFVVGHINEANPTARLQPDYFGGMTDMDMAIAEVLRREADRLGIVGSQEVVTNYLTALTTPRGGPKSLLTSKIMQSVCREIHASEQAVYEALEDEWRLRQVQRMLGGSGSEAIPPETYWDAHQKLNVQQDMELAVLPAADFVDESLEPSDAELAEFFGQYRENFPNTTPEGEPEPGRPGFYQPRRAQFAYVEGTAEDYIDQVEVTPEEIEAEYLRRYPPPISDDAESTTPGGAIPDGPQLPDPFLNGPNLPPIPMLPGTPSGEAPMTDEGATVPMEESDSTPADPADIEVSEEDGDATPEGTAPAPDAEADASTSDEATNETPEATGEEPAPTTDGSCDDPVAEESDDAAAESTEAPADDQPAGDDQPAAPLDETTEESTAETTEPEATTEAPADAAADDTTPAGDDAAPNDEAATQETPAEPAPFTLSESEIPPPPHLPTAPATIGPPPLTDELKAEIADYLRLLKADALLAEEMNAYASAFEKQITPFAVLPPESDEHMSSAEVLDAARKLATEEEGDDDRETFEFYFAQSPLLSSTELRDSEDHAFGSAVQPTQFGTSQPMSLVMFQNFETDLFRPELAESPTQSSVFDDAPPPPESRFVVWKIADLPDYAPQNLDDDREGTDKKVREQVVEAWRLYQARDAVEARGAELVAMAEAKTEPFTTIFADTKIAGDEGLNLTTTESGMISWYRQSSSANPFQPSPPEISKIPGLPDIELGDPFMHEVFREMEVGQTRAVWNMDHTHLFVVRVSKRVPSSLDAFMTGLPGAFDLAQQPFAMSVPPVLLLAGQQLRQHQANGVDLMEKYEVQFPDEPAQ